MSLWRGSGRAPDRIGSVRLRSRPARTLLPGQGFIGLLDPRLVRDLWRAMGGADVVHVHAGRDLVSLAALAVAALRRVPCVAQTHGMVEPRTALPVRLFDLLYLPLLRRTRTCFVLTEQERRLVARVLGPDGPPLRILPNGIRPGPPEPGPRRPRDPMCCSWPGCIRASVRKPSWRWPRWSTRSCPRPGSRCTARTTDRCPPYAGSSPTG
ncbi:glycosyltransferase [Streptomyces diastatochromogenes]|nr:glycosyltransferase [Streptomyces diastatochromogenes]